MRDTEECRALADKYLIITTRNSMEEPVVTFPEYGYRLQIIIIRFKYIVHRKTNMTISKPEILQKSTNVN